MELTSDDLRRRCTRLEEELAESRRRVSELTERLPGPVCGGSARNVMSLDHPLHDRRTFLNTLLETIPIPVFYKDRNGRYIGFNRAFSAFFGAPGDSLVGKTVFDICPRDLAETYHAKDRELLENGGVQHYESPLRNAEGSERYVVFNKAAFLDEAGEISGIIGTVLDITERRRAEQALAESRQKYLSMVDNVGIGVAMISPDMEILELNRQMRTWFPDIDCSGRPTCYRSFNSPPLDDVCGWCPTVRTLQDGEVHENITSTPTGNDVRHYRIVSSPILDEEGQVMAAIEMVEDVTEKHLMEEQLRQAQKLESIGTLAGGIGHEFNNILYAIIGNTELVMANTPAGSETGPWLDEIMKGGERAQVLVRQILSFSRDTRSERDSIRCTPVVKDALKLARASLPSTVEIGSTFACASDTILSNVEEIHRIVMNLCTNAAQSLDGKTGRIDVTLENRDRERDDDDGRSGTCPARDVVLTVRDTGCGIPDRILDRIFDPFFTTKPPGAGTGLGLSVVHGIVKELGGSVSAQSTEGEGAVFTVLIPATEEVQEEEEREKDDCRRAGGTILVVDDDRAIADLISRMLAGAGYEVVTRKGSPEALETFRQEPFRFDLVITDQAMPKMTGDSLAAEMIAIRPDLPLILFTGDMSGVSKKRVRELGFGRVLLKPIRKADLIESVGSLLAKNTIRE